MLITLQSYNWLIPKNCENRHFDVEAEVVPFCPMSHRWDKWDKWDKVGQVGQSGTSGTKWDKLIQRSPLLHFPVFCFRKSDKYFASAGLLVILQYIWTTRCLPPAAMYLTILNK